MHSNIPMTFFVDVL